MKKLLLVMLIFGVFCACQVKAYSLNGVEGDYLEGDASYNDIAGNTIEFMQYNLGATEDNIDGLLFQWGNNYAYPNSGELARAIESGETMSEYSKYYWYLNNYGNFFREVDDQGPCPDGYHVPSMNERNNLFISRCMNNEECDERYLIENYEMFNEFGAPFEGLKNVWMIYDNDYQDTYKNVIDKFISDFGIQLPGYRDFDNIVNLGIYGNYRSSNILSEYMGISRFFYIFPTAWTGPHFGRGFGQSVRCFKDSYTNDVAPETLSLELFEGGEGIDDELDLGNDSWKGRMFVTEDTEINQDLLTSKLQLKQPDEGFEWVWYEDNERNDRVQSGTKILESYTKFYVFLEKNSYKVILDSNEQGEGEMQELIIKYMVDGGENEKVLPSLTRNGYRFLGWNTKKDGTGTGYDAGNIKSNIGNVGDEIILYAQWEKLGYSGGGGRGGGSHSSEDGFNDSHSSVEEKQQEDVDEKGDNTISIGTVVESIEPNKEIENEDLEESLEKDTQNNGINGLDFEFQSTTENPTENERLDSFTFAKENGITTKDTIQSAQMDGKLTRIAMAKMLSQYAINVLGQTPDTSKTVKFKDVTSKKDADYDDGVTLAYQLGIMGQNMPNNRFRPNDEVSRAEFVTALSRLLYQTTDGEYRNTARYYIHHMEKLVSEGVITKADPSMKERRGYVMIMLMRSAKK